jgi:hypothetical protein
VLKTHRFRAPKAFAFISLVAALLALPSPISSPSIVSAASAPALGYVSSQGTRVTFQGTGVLATAVNQQPALSAFNVQVDGVRVDVVSLDFSLPLFLDLVLATTIYQGSTASVTYTAPSTVDNTLNNAALQTSNGSDVVSFSFQLDTANAAFRVGVPSAPTVEVGVESATITVATTASPTPRSYLVTASPGGATCTVTGTAGSCTISGLTAGTSYTFTTVGKRNGMADSFLSPVSASVTVLAKTVAPVTNVSTDTTAPPATTAAPVASAPPATPESNAPSWDADPATESETDEFTEGFWPSAIPGNIIITNQVGFTLDKKNGIRPKIRMKNYAGRIKMTISATYKDGAKTKKYKCTYAPFGSTKKMKTAKWKWYTPKKACILPKPLVTALQTGTTKLSANGKWSRQWLTSAKKARPDKTKIKPRTLKYTMRARPAVAK